MPSIRETKTKIVIAKLPSAYLEFAEKAYGRKFTCDDDLMHALEHETFDKRAKFLAAMTESFGFEFTSPVEVFRYVSGERLSEFQPLSPPPGVPTAFEVATKRADQLFSSFEERIPLANANRKFAFFVQEVLVYGSYLRREKTVGDIDVAMQFAMKTEAKLDERIGFFMRRDNVDRRGGYDRAITEISKFLTNRSKYFHDSDADTVKRLYPYQVVYRMPKLQQYVRLVDKTASWPTVDHLHQFVERAELNEQEKKRRVSTKSPRSKRSIGR